jgi:uncharacterized MAPEG superfamily protein
MTAPPDSTSAHRIDERLIWPDESARSRQRRLPSRRRAPTLALMNTELVVLAWGCILALVHIFAAVRVKTRQYGTKWNMGARDEALPPPEPIVGRLARAQANYFETFPIAAAAILIVTVADRTDDWTAIGALNWLVARIVYLPLYALGIPKVRTLVFLVSIVGILLILRPILFG